MPRCAVGRVDLIQHAEAAPDRPLVRVAGEVDRGEQQHDRREAQRRDPDPGEGCSQGSILLHNGHMIDSPAQPEFDELATTLALDGAARSQMMGRPMLAIGGKMFACLSGPVLAVKLGRDTEEFAEAIDLPGARVFKPGGESQRSFLDWVELPLDAIGDWERFARAALAFTAAGAGKR
jgi:hypothetical protein